jgi:inward rectifier potassium channel
MSGGKENINVNIIGSVKLDGSAEKDSNFQDLGFGTQVSRSSNRFINKDGSFNVRKRGLPFYKTVNLYHLLVNMTWPRFFAVVVLSYIAENILFATLYYVTGIEGLQGVHAETEIGKYLEAFFFSSQTITTLGYGRIAPVGAVTSAIAAVESLLGLLAFALVTGLLYGRFSRPTANIIFSKNAVVAPYKDVSSIQFKIANQWDSQLIEVEVQVILGMFVQADGHTKRILHQLELERDKIPTFPLTWNVVHPIEKNSPLYGLNEKQFHEADIELMVMVKAFDQTFSQNVYKLSSYKHNEILWNRKFKINFETDEDGVIAVDLSKMDETVVVN